jgi:hypothetical protein
MSDLPPGKVQPGPALLRLALVGLVTACAYTAVAWWPTHALAGPDATTGLLCGVVLALLGGQAGNVPCVLALTKTPRAHANAILLGLAMRFGVTGALAIAAALSGWVPAKATVLSVALSQMAFLLVDVLGQLKLLKRASGGAA